mmetsp:Transcript_113066/g.314692  ORF Transcript_113066/g.314692 Transcript_113066/m.314692 type:complete len:218 (-) Transcript_113066:165-818(-)
MEINTPVGFIAANSARPQAFRVAGPPGRVQTTKSDCRKTSSLPVPSSVSLAKQTMSANSLPLRLRVFLSAMTCMPKALQKRAVVWAMSPKPMKPAVLPCNSAIINFSQLRLARLCCNRGTCLLKCSMAPRAYSARDRENAPLAFVRGICGPPASEFMTGTTVSTPAAMLCTHFTFGQCGHNSFKTAGVPPAKTTGTITSTSASRLELSKLARSFPTM